jgi:hypothetical protein
VVGRPFPARTGQRWSPAVIRLPKGQRRFLSFTNLVEVHLLAAMRRKHALKLDAIRKAVRYVHDALDVEHALASEQFKTNGVDLFVERLGKIINASREGSGSAGTSSNEAAVANVSLIRRLRRRP